MLVDDEYEDVWVIRTCVSRTNDDTMLSRKRLGVLELGGVNSRSLVDFLMMLAMSHLAR